MKYDEKKSVKINAYGRVQGVGFRYSTIKVAQQFEISGWVKNAWDGSVEIQATGSPQNLNKFIQVIKESPTPYGKVTKTIINYIPNQKIKGFNVKY